MTLVDYILQKIDEEKKRDAEIVVRYQLGISRGAWFEYWEDEIYPSLDKAKQRLKAIMWDAPMVVKQRWWTYGNYKAKLAPFSEQVILLYYERQYWAPQAFSSSREELVEEAAESLREIDFMIAQDAKHAWEKMEYMGTLPLATLTGLLATDKLDEADKCEVLIAIGRQANPLTAQQCLDLILPYLNHAIPRTRYGAVRGLMNLMNPAVLTPMQARLEIERDPIIKSMLVHGIEHLEGQTHAYEQYEDIAKDYHHASE